MVRQKLIAVSKVQPNDRIKSVLEKDIAFLVKTVFKKLNQNGLLSRQQYEDVELHIIGPLQTNKTRAAMEIADSIHTLDRPKLAKNMARLAQELGKCPELFVQVNTGEEQQNQVFRLKKLRLLLKNV